MEEALHDAFMGIIIFSFLVLFIAIIFDNNRQSLFIEIIRIFGDWFNNVRLMM